MILILQFTIVKEVGEVRPRDIKLGITQFCEIFEANKIRQVGGYPLAEKNCQGELGTSLKRKVNVAYPNVGLF